MLLFTPPNTKLGRIKTRKTFKTLFYTFFIRFKGTEKGFQCVRSKRKIFGNPLAKYSGFKHYHVNFPVREQCVQPRVLWPKIDFREISEEYR